MKLTGDESPEELTEHGRQIVLRQLTMMDRTRSQLLDAQKSRGVPPEIAERVVARFEEVGLVSDRDYADKFVRSRLAERPTSRRALARDLRGKGIDDSLANNALAQVSDEDEEAAAIALAAKKAAATTGLEDHVRRRRIYAALARRGFGPETCRRATAAALDDDQDNYLD